MEQEPVTLFLGQTIGYWVQTVAIIASAVGAITVIWHNGRTAKRRATIDLIIAEQRDDEYNQKYASVSKLIKKKECLVDFAKFLNEQHEELDNIRFVLNRLEFIAQGIRKGAFEEAIYKDLTYTNFIDLWEAVKPLVMEIRRRKNNTDTFYQEIEWLANRWKKKGNKIKRVKITQYSSD